jgi:hypothetical protein
MKRTVMILQKLILAGQKVRIWKEFSVRIVGNSKENLACSKRNDWPVT